MCGSEALWGQARRPSARCCVKVLLRFCYRDAGSCNRSRRSLCRFSGNPNHTQNSPQPASCETIPLELRANSVVVGAYPPARVDNPLVVTSYPFN